MILLIGTYRRAKLFQMAKRSLCITFRPIPAFEDEVGSTAIKIKDMDLGMMKMLIDRSSESRFSSDVAPVLVELS